jgi:hypothetical protein
MHMSLPHWSDWAADLGNMCTVCWQWCLVALDNLIWQLLHMAIMGGTHHPPVWEANVLQAWPRLSIPVTLTINELCATFVDTADAQWTCWHTSFMIKACNVF